MNAVIDVFSESKVEENILLDFQLCSKLIEVILSLQHPTFIGVKNILNSKKCLKLQNLFLEPF